MRRSSSGKQVVEVSGETWWYFAVHNRVAAAGPLHMNVSVVAVAGGASPAATCQAANEAAAAEVAARYGVPRDEAAKCKDSGSDVFCSCRGTCVTVNSVASCQCASSWDGECQMLTASARSLHGSRAWLAPPQGLGARPPSSARSKSCSTRPSPSAACATCAKMRWRWSATSGGSSACPSRCRRTRDSTSAWSATATPRTQTFMCPRCCLAPCSISLALWAPAATECVELPPLGWTSARGRGEGMGARKFRRHSLATARPIPGKPPAREPLAVRPLLARRVCQIAGHLPRDGGAAGVAGRR